ncbi:putative efflux pump antibiotic resistance protein [Plenodomus tracheiphilus IPT5]|uniref:Efflux pump antibiotic resistance protein n=1 Tax=Plenodomus tracheiphilus IPT5 TaxID=1408161 RepID=A0A6A7BCG3_9PLEO|nr:putative efflux pump antibiotic resistance protein [Plenodomus tracheiphilus IPT5]
MASTSSLRKSAKKQNPVTVGTPHVDIDSKQEAPPVPLKDEYADAEQNYNPRSPKFWFIILSVYLSFFLVALDRMVIATAIPTITNTFGSIEDIGWYGSAYMLTCAIFNPLYGKIYQLYDTKWTYLTSIIIFEGGSALCGAAPSSPALIVGRAIAGIGAAGIGCGAIMVIIPLVPLRKRPVFTSFFGMAFAVSSILGPFVGGAFTDSARLTWRFCFYINIPIGGFAFAAVFFMLQLPTVPMEKLTLVDQAKSLDPLGLLFFAPSMVCFILALQWGGTTYSWSEPKIIGLIVIFVVTFIAFLVVEYKLPDTAMAPPRVVLNRSVGGAMIFVFFMAGGMMNAAYYIAIWFQAAQGQSAMQAGIRTIPMVLSLVLFGIVSAVFTQKIGYYVPAMLVSPIIAAIGSGLLSTLTPQASSAKWIGFQVLYGGGLGIGAQTANLASQVVLPRKDVALGSAMMFFMQQLGGSVFLAVGQNIFSGQLITRLAGVAGLDMEAIIHTGATDLRTTVSPNKIETVVNSYSYALTRVFILSAALSACMIVGSLMVEWRSIKKPDDARAESAGGDAENNAGLVK